MPSLFRSLQAFFRRPATRELLWWCLPALLVGLVLRVVLTVHMPFGYFHDDAPDFLTTPEKLLFEFDWELHAKKTFLVPTLFTIPFLLPFPALIVIPIAQHLLGLVMVVLVGLLCRLWFARWQLFIIPLTMLAAANPFFLWYEHTLMAETIFVFCTLLLALAGTLYALDPTRRRFIFLCVTLVLEAGARPEGKLLFGFGLFLLVLIHFRRELPLRPFRFRGTAWPRLAIMLALALVIQLTTKTSQAGLLLYTSVVRLTPTDLKVAPGFDQYIGPLRDDLQKRWEEGPTFPRVRDRRAVAEAVSRYLTENPKAGKGGRHEGVNDFCLKLAVETCRRNLLKLPSHAYHKFWAVAGESPAGYLDEIWLFEKQRDALIGSPERNLRLSRRLTGQAMTSESELNAFIDRNYGAVPWFNVLTDAWLGVLNSVRFGDRPYTERGFLLTYFGLPVYFIIAAAGLVVAMVRREPVQPFHIAWGLALLGFFFTIMLTANVRPRFRFVFEPFWYLYIALLIDTLLLALRVKRPASTPAPAPAA